MRIEDLLGKNPADDAADGEADEATEADTQ